MSFTILLKDQSADSRRSPSYTQPRKAGGQKAASYLVEEIQLDLKKSMFQDSLIAFN